MDEALISQKLWMALDRTRYMEAGKSFMMVDRPFWKDTDPATGRPLMRVEGSWRPQSDENPGSSNFYPRLGLWALPD